MFTWKTANETVLVVDFFVVMEYLKLCVVSVCVGVEGFKNKISNWKNKIIFGVEVVSVIFIKIRVFNNFFFFCVFSNAFFSFSLPIKALYSSDYLHLIDFFYFILLNVSVFVVR